MGPRPREASFVSRKNDLTQVVRGRSETMGRWGIPNSWLLASDIALGPETLRAIRLGDLRLCSDPSSGMGSSLSHCLPESWSRGCLRKPGRDPQAEPSPLSSSLPGFSLPELYSYSLTLPLDSCRKLREHDVNMKLALGKLVKKQ